MKKFILFFPMLIIGCVGNENIEQTTPQEFLRAPECINSDRVELFQYGDETTLLEVYICQDKLKYPGEECKRGLKYNGYVYNYDKKLVAVNTKQFIGTEESIKAHMFDGSVIGLGTGCLVPDGTYSYVTPIGVQKTVQKVKYSRAGIKNPEYEKWISEQEAKVKEHK